MTHSYVYIHTYVHVYIIMQLFAQQLVQPNNKEHIDLDYWPFVSDEWFLSQRASKAGSVSMLWRLSCFNSACWSRSFAISGPYWGYISAWSVCWESGNSLVAPRFLCQDHHFANRVWCTYFEDHCTIWCAIFQLSAIYVYMFYLKGYCT